LPRAACKAGGQRAQSTFADYVLTYHDHKLGVIEAKKRSLPDTEGVGLAKRDAARLHIRYAYSTNGEGIYQIDMQTGEEGNISTYPTPEELWSLTYAETNLWRAVAFACEATRAPL